jgi:hypothetical protein
MRDWRGFAICGLHVSREEGVRMIRIIAIGVLVLSGCQMQQPQPQECIAADLQGFVGEPLSMLEGQDLPQPNRIIGPDTAVTMDWNPMRLNIAHDKAHSITRIYCG